MEESDEEEGAVSDTETEMIDSEIAGNANAGGDIQKEIQLEEPVPTVEAVAVAEVPETDANETGQPETEPELIATEEPEAEELPEVEIEKRVERMLDIVGLARYRTYYPQQLSASMEQRVVIARNFAINPDLLLMDEPYGQLDVKLRYYLEDELMRIWKELGSTVAFITHNIEEAVYVAERILVLTNKPTKVKAEIQVDLPRPRKLIDPRFVELRRQVTELIRWW